MNMNQLFQFQMVAQKGSISGAAQALFLSQSTLSQSMKSLEAEIGAQLLLRSVNGISLTAMGKEFLAQATPLCEQFTSLSNLSKLLPNTVPTLSLSVFYTGYIAHAFTLLCKKYEAENPDFSISANSFPDMVDHLRSGKASLGVFIMMSSSRLLCLNKLEQNKLSFTPLMKMNAYIMLRENHPLLSGGDVDGLKTEDLEDYPYTSSREKFSSLEPLDWISFAGSSRRKRNTFWICSRENLTDIILQTNAFTIVPLPAADGEPPVYPQGIVCLPLRDSVLYYELGYIHMTSQPLSQTESDYIDLLTKELHTVQSA
jgi:DNA-binding transcriptional LysR family regulator